MVKGKRTNRKYSPEFKRSVIMDMRENRLGVRETERKCGISHSVILRWERIYLEEGAVGYLSSGKTFKSDDEFIIRPKDYIHYYNNKRISKKTKGLTPEFNRSQSLVS